MVAFNRDVFFDSVRASLFNGKLTQQQVDGMSFKLAVWEDHPYSDDLRWLAYPFATSYHETSATMWPIEEYQHGAGMSYGVPDPETGETYYGRGDVQLTWRDNYAKATEKLGLTGDDDLEWHAERALDPSISADVMYIGMVEGWFRASSDGKRQTLERYFNASKDDSYGAREIINGDKSKVPSWSNGVSIGNLIKGYHSKFLTALQAAASVAPSPEPEPEPEPSPEPEPEIGEVVIDITAPAGLRVTVRINGDDMI